jgi:hypothetical protein
MATRKASDSNLTGKKYNDASAGGAKIVATADVGQAGSAVDFPNNRAFNNGAANITPVNAATGGVPQTYTVTSTPGSYATTSAAPVTVTGLQTGTAYTFSVVANTDSGTTAFTGSTNSITSTTVPQAPTSVAVRGRESSIDVTFTAPAGNGGAAISSYTATAYSGATAVSTATGASSPLTITGLTNGTSYTVKVRATNANGSSAESTASSSVQPVAASWQLSQTFTSSGTFTVPSGATAMGAVVTGGGASGGGGGSGGYPGPTSGSGGNSSYIAGFNSVAVSSGQTYSVTVGGQGGQSTFSNVYASPNTYGTNATTLASGSGGRSTGGGGMFTATQFSNRSGQSGGSADAAPSLTISAATRTIGGGGGGGGGGGAGPNGFGAGGGGGGGSNGGGNGGNGGDGFVGIPTGNNGNAGNDASQSTYGAGGGGGGSGGTGNAALLGARNGGGGGAGAPGAVYVYTLAYASNAYA